MVDTSTRLNAAFDGNDIRGVTSVDGTAFWASGNGSASTGGVHYLKLGALGSTQILAVPANARVVHVIAGQLYGSSGSGAFVNVFTVGAGTPTVAGQTATTLNGLPVVAGPSPYSFVLADINPNVAGVDTLYIADDRAPGVNTGGIQKWSFDGMTWKIVTTFNNGVATGVRGLAGAVSGTVVTLLATTTEGSANTVVVFTDDQVNMNPKGTVIATAPANTVYRGIALSPN